MSQVTHAYVGQMPCGCVPCLVVDDEQRDDTARSVAGWIRQGWAVERVEITAVRAGGVLGQCAQHKKSPTEEARQGSRL